MGHEGAGVGTDEGRDLLIVRIEGAGAVAAEEEQQVVAILHAFDGLLETVEAYSSRDAVIVVKTFVVVVRGKGAY